MDRGGPWVCKESDMTEGRNTNAFIRTTAHYKKSLPCWVYIRKWMINIIKHKIMRTRRLVALIKCDVWNVPKHVSHVLTSTADSHFVKLYRGWKMIIFLIVIFILYLFSGIFLQRRRFFFVVVDRPQKYNWYFILNLYPNNFLNSIVLEAFMHVFQRIF